MAELNIGRTWLQALMTDGLPFVCLNPNTPHPKLRRYRYDLQAVMDWLAARNAAAPSKATPAASAETPTPCATADQKGVER